MADTDLSKENPGKTGWIKTLGKGLLVITAFWVVSGKISWTHLWKLVQTAHPGWLMAAFLLLNASKVLSAVRLQYYWRAIGVVLSGEENLRLYYQGMFYNLLLPGGIGGDGYKVWLLRKKTSSPYPKLILAIVLDRLSGLLPLQFLLSLLLIPVLQLPVATVVVLLSGQFIVYHLGKIGLRIFFPDFKSVYAITSLWGLIVQLLQLMCAVCILAAIDTDSDYTVYLLLFLISSVVAIMPFTIAGIGAREVAVIAAGWYVLPQASPLAYEKPVVLTLLFFGLTVLSALPGMIVKVSLPGIPLDSDTSEKLPENVVEKPPGKYIPPFVEALDRNR